MKYFLLAIFLCLFVGCQSNDTTATTPPADTAEQQSGGYYSNSNSATNDTEAEDAEAEEGEVEESDTQYQSSAASGTVEYYNKNTGTNASYDLDVEYDGSGDVDRIIFPSGGYIGQNHITDQTQNGDGTITVTTDEGQEFTVDEENGGEEAEEE